MTALIILTPMKYYLILIWRKSDPYNRHWLTRNSLEEARKVASSFEEDNDSVTHIYEMPQIDLRYE